MVLLQMAGGPELFMFLMMFVLMGVVPLAVVVAVIYLLYQIRQDTKSMAASLEQIDADQSSAATSGDSVDPRDDERPRGTE